MKAIVNAQKFAEAVQWIAPSPITTGAWRSEAIGFGFSENRVTLWTGNVALVEYHIERVPKGDPTDEVLWVDRKLVEAFGSIVASTSTKEMSFDTSGTALKVNIGRREADWSLLKKSSRRDEQRLMKVAGMTPEQSLSTWSSFVFRAVAAASKNASDPRLRCVFLCKSGLGLATDSILAVKGRGPQLKNGLPLPLEFIRMWSSLQENAEVHRYPGGVALIAPNASILHPISTEMLKFPINQLLAWECAYKKASLVRFSWPQWESAAKRCLTYGAVSGDDQTIITLTIKGGKAVWRVKVGGSEYTEEIAVQGKVEHEFRFTFRHLKSLLALAPNEKVLECQFQDDLPYEFRLGSMKFYLVRLAEK